VKRAIGDSLALSRLGFNSREEIMATAKKSNKSTKRLRKVSKLEEQKPLTKGSLPTDSVSLPFGHIEIKYTLQGL
jgi:hypothetical protein